MLDLQNILNKVIANTNELFEAEAGSVALLEPSNQQIVIYAAVGEGADAVRGVSLPVGKGIVGWVISNEQPTIVPDVSLDNRFYASVDEQIGFHTQSIMCAPLWVDGHIIGVIELINIHPDYLNDNGLKILTVFADHAALAIENGQLLAEARQWSEQQTLLFAPQTEITSDRALETIVNMVSRQLLEVLKVDLCLISRWDEGQKQLRILHSQANTALPQLQKIARSLANSPLTWALTAETPPILYANDPDLTPATADWLNLLQVHLLFAMPLTYHREVIGLVEVARVHSAEPLTKDDIRMAEIIVAQAAATIEHATRYDATARRLAETNVLQQVMMAAAAKLDFDDVLHETIKALHRALGIERLAVILPASPGKIATTHPATIGFPNDTVMIPIENSAPGWVIHHGRPLLLPNNTESNPYHELRQDTHSAMYVPVMLDDKVMAVLCAESPRLNAFGESDLRLFGAIAAELAIALKNAKLFEAEHRLASQRQAMLDIFADLSSELQPEVLFQRIIERAVQVIPHADAGSFIIPKGTMFVYAAAVGMDIKTLQQFAFSRESMLREIPPPQKVRHISKADLSAISRQNMLPNLNFGSFKQVGLVKIESTIQAGLHTSDDILGVLSIDSFSGPTAFTEDDEQTLLLFANQASIALQNARLFDEVRTAEANYRDLFDNANDFIITLDGKFRLTSANKVTLKTSGYSLAELLHVPITKFLAPKQIPLLYKALKTHIAHTEMAAPLELTILGKNQQEILLEATIRIQHHNGRPIGIHCIARDITQRRVLEQQLQQNEKLSAIGKLVAGVAHELNNPLTAVIGYASLLQDSDIASVYKNDLEAIFRHAQRARFIVRDLLTFAQRVNLNPKPIQLNEVLQLSLTQMKSNINNHQIEVITHLAPNLPITMGDPRQLEQVFINLLTNACQALEKMTCPRQIVISSQKINQTILIKLVDNGGGIPAEILKQIFEPFFSTKEMGQGTGLGLSICFGIISEHKGRIWADNAPDSGAVFYIELPIKTPPIAPKLPEKMANNRHVKQPHLQILAIDDEGTVLELLNRVLSPLGHQVDLVSNGHTALEKLGQNSYDLIICDVLIPYLSGIELYKIAREKFPETAQKFLFVTGNATDLQTKHFLEKSGLPWLAKPFLPTELEILINQHADKRI